MNSLSYTRTISDFEAEEIGINQWKIEEARKKAPAILAKRKKEAEIARAEQLQREKEEEEKKEELKNHLNYRANEIIKMKKGQYKTFARLSEVTPLYPPKGKSFEIFKETVTVKDIINLGEQIIEHIESLDKKRQCIESVKRFIELKTRILLYAEYIADCDKKLPYFQRVNLVDLEHEKKDSLKRNHTLWRSLVALLKSKTHTGD